ncbi:MAG TPA: S41 family peptidase [Candidatus Paceibacterota bacterium]|nr:S41 family peptidase [Candidatus Paceibacterota bacterium]
MTKETKKKMLGIIAIVVLGCVILGSGVWIGWTAGRKYPENIVVSSAADIGSGSSTTDADFSTFWAAWQDITDESLWVPSTTPQERMYGAITGMVASLGDPYTEFFTPADSDQFQEDITGNFGGIGAELGENSSTEIVVISAISSTPAFAAGLKPEDIITSINGSSTASMNIDDAVNLIRGTVGTNVTLGILRQGWSAPKDFTITRANIQVPTVEFSMKGNIADIQLNEFTQDADGLFYTALQKAVNANAQGIVLDLRGDPGGYLEVAVDISGYFLKPGSQVVKEVGRSVPTQNYTASGSGALDTMPMAILTDGGTASAAEILSGALNDDRGVPLVGAKTFGKGTVQQLETLPDGSSLKITVAHWVLPSGRILDYDGLLPNYPVAITDAEVAAGQDPQLAEALQIVTDEINGTPLPPSADTTPTSSVATASSTVSPSDGSSD